MKSELLRNRAVGMFQTEVLEAARGEGFAAYTGALPAKHSELQ
jgi:hypothetical protein